MTIYRQAQQAQAEIVRELADYPWHMRQFWVRHPDGYLIRPAQKILSVNPATYRRQVADAFERDTPRITQELLAVKQTADSLVQQGDYLGAATIYETLVTEIFEQSHLYYDEEAEYDDYYEEERYFPEEEGLDKLVGECIEALGNCLADEQADRVAREKIIEVLFDIYQHDLHADNSHGFRCQRSGPAREIHNAAGTTDYRGVDSRCTDRRRGRDHWLPAQGLWQVLAGPGERYPRR